MRGLAVCVVALQSAAVFWFLIDKVARALTSAGSLSSRDSRRAVLDAVFDTVLAVYQAASQFIGTLLAHATILVAALLLLVAAVVVTQHAGVIIQLMDHAYEAAYHPVVKPLVQVHFAKKRDQMLTERQGGLRPPLQPPDSCGGPCSRGYRP